MFFHFLIHLVIVIAAYLSKKQITKQKNDDLKLI